MGSINAEQWTQPKTNSSQQLSRFLESVRRETRYETLVLFGRRQAIGSCLSYVDLEIVQTPILLLDTQTTWTLAEMHFNQNLLIVHCVQRRFDRVSFERLLDFMGVSRSTKVIFYWQRKFTVSALEQVLEPLHAHCQRAFMLNVLNVFEDFHVTHKYFSYSQFSQQHTIERRLGKDTFFPSPLANMHRASIRTLPDSNEPRTIIYYSENGGVTVTGYIAKLVFEFATKHNASLEYPKAVRPDIVYFYGDLINMSLANELDIPMSVDSPAGFVTLEGCSYIIEQGWWRPMLPVRDNQGVPDFYGHLLFSPLNMMLLVLWLIFTVLITFHILWMNGSGKKRQRFIRIWIYTAFSTTLRSVLGQASVLPPLVPISVSLKILYFFLFACGIFSTTGYISCLQSFLTNPFPSPQIETIDDLLASDVRVRVSPKEYEFLSSYMSEDFFEEVKGIFSKTRTLEAFYEERKSLNRRYGYVVTSSVWAIFQELQKYLPRPLFRVTKNIYFSKRFYLCFPLQPYSIYRDSLNVFISQVLSSGLFAYWQGTVFDDMVTAGKFQRFGIPHSELESAHAFTVFDFLWIWIFWVIGLAISFLALLVEFLTKRMHIRRRVAKLQRRRKSKRVWLD